MLPDKWVRKIHTLSILETLRSPAAPVHHESLGPKTQKAIATSVSDAHKQVEVQGTRLVAGNESDTAPMLITELYRFLGAPEDTAQFLSIDDHFNARTYGGSLPDDPWGEGRNQKAVSICSLPHFTAMRQG